MFLYLLAAAILVLPTAVVLKTAGALRRVWIILASISLAVLFFGLLGELAVFVRRDDLIREGSYNSVKNVLMTLETFCTVGVVGFSVGAFSHKKPGPKVNSYDRTQKAA